MGLDSAVVHATVAVWDVPHYQRRAEHSICCKLIYENDNNCAEKSKSLTSGHCSTQTDEREWLVKQK